jgi:cobalamin biosynthetic protein CobC
MTLPDPTSSKPSATPKAAPSPEAPVTHGGDLDAARAHFPGAPEPIVDLSTGVNPHPYPIGDISVEVFARLPEPAALARLTSIAAAFYGAPSPEHVVAAPGSQVLMAMIADLVPQGRATMLGPTYAEHARVAALSGHEVSTVETLDKFDQASLAVVVNPNNPDGRVVSRDELLAAAERATRQGGVLVSDEAFMEVGPESTSLANGVDLAPIAVLRSFGKFFGLSGLRLSFAVASPQLASQLRARLGPWPVSGPAISIGSTALADQAWIAETRVRLSAASKRLTSLLQTSGLATIGQTDLFCLVRTEDGKQVFAILGEAGIFVRRFDEYPQLLRFGLPGKEIEWRRLSDALQALS